LTRKRSDRRDEEAGSNVNSVRDRRRKRRSRGK